MGLSSINQHGLWEKRPQLARDGHISVLSVDIADFNSPSTHLVDELGRGKTARDCTADEMAAEVWRQIVTALTNDADNVAEALLPWPVWYALDRGLRMESGSGQGGGRVVRNETPYLVPIVGDWENRPGGDPWNPHGTSLTYVLSHGGWLADLEDRGVWQARHGGYQVHHNSVVFAGTWNRTFTRLTSMEAACESARHAVNAILDHYVWVGSDGSDEREHTTLPGVSRMAFSTRGCRAPYECRLLPATTATSSMSRTANPPTPDRCASWTRSTASSRCLIRWTPSSHPLEVNRDYAERQQPATAGLSAGVAAVA